MTYDGNPRFVSVSYRQGLYDCFTQALPGDEWGELVQAMIELSSRMLSVSDDTRLDTLLGWIAEELKRANEEGWWYEDYEDEVLRARNEVEEYINDCKNRWTTYAPEVVQLELEIAHTPDWMRKPTAEFAKRVERGKVLQERERLTKALADVDERLRGLE